MKPANRRPRWVERDFKVAPNDGLLQPLGATPADELKLGMIRLISRCGLTNNQRSFIDTAVADVHSTQL